VSDTCLVLDQFTPVISIMFRFIYP